jgi:hypothetical protein
MVFDSPQWLWATALALIVPIIHLLGRRAIQPVSIPSLMWLDQFKTQDRRRNKLKEWLLVLLRMLVISLFFFSLAGPKISSKSTKLLVDNTPVFWSQKESWLPMALDLLPKEMYTLHVRGGISLGTFRYDELEEALEDWPPSSAPLQNFEKATLISAGFTSLPTGASQYYLPKRKALFNSSVALVNENTREQTFTIINGPHNGGWELRDSSKLLLQEFDSIVSIPWWSIPSDELFLSYTGDSIIEDNRQKLYRPSRLPIIAVNAKGSSNLSALPIDQKLTYTNATDLASLPLKAILVLNGFSFIPDVLTNEDYIILRIAGAPTKTLEEEALPVLDENFYKDYFIGASEQNRWPNPRLWSGDNMTHLQPFLRTSGGIVIAGWQKIVDGPTIYEQSFPIENSDHPYYRALLQWASSHQLQKHKVELINYGDDKYDANVRRLEEDKVQYYSWSTTPTNTRSSVQFWSESKIALALALFCALIALIFAKI